jgi:hypothetical protein
METGVCALSQEASTGGMTMRPQDSQPLPGVLNAQSFSTADDRGRSSLS